MSSVFKKEDKFEVNDMVNLKTGEWRVGNPKNLAEGKYYSLDDINGSDVEAYAPADVVDKLIKTKTKQKQSVIVESWKDVKGVGWVAKLKK